MKQRISVEQLQELTFSQQDKLREWWKPEIGDTFYGEYKFRHIIGVFFVGQDVGEWDRESFDISDLNETCIPLLSIGQCIELLLDKAVDPTNEPFELFISEDLCDELWGLVRITL